jgi:hypothetical protein
MTYLNHAHFNNTARTNAMSKYKLSQNNMALLKNLTPNQHRLSAAQVNREVCSQMNDVSFRNELSQTTIDATMEKITVVLEDLYSTLQNMSELSITDQEAIRLFEGLVNRISAVPELTTLVSVPLYSHDGNPGSSITSTSIMHGLDALMNAASSVESSTGSTGAISTRADLIEATLIAAGATKDDLITAVGVIKNDILKAKTYTESVVKRQFTNAIHMAEILSDHEHRKANLNSKLNNKKQMMMDSEKLADTINTLEHFVM